MVRGRICIKGGPSLRAHLFKIILAYDNFFSNQDTDCILKKLLNILRWNDKEMFITLSTFLHERAKLWNVYVLLRGSTPLKNVCGPIMFIFSGKM